MRPRAAAAGIALALVAAFGACGDDDDTGVIGDPEGAAATTEPSSATTGETSGDGSAATTIGGEPSATTSVTAPGEPADDCLIAESDVEAALGFPVKAPVEQDVGGGNGCRYDYQEGLGNIGIREYAGNGEEGHDTFLKTFADAEEFEIDGRRAAWSTQGSILDVVDGADQLQVQITQQRRGDAVDDVKQTSIDLMRAVLASR